MITSKFQEQPEDEPNAAASDTDDIARRLATMPVPIDGVLFPWEWKEKWAKWDGMYGPRAHCEWCGESNVLKSTMKHGRCPHCYAAWVKCQGWRNLR